MTPVYLAGASAEHERVTKWAAALDATGHFQLTSRWFDSAAEWAGQDERLPRRDQMQHALADFSALRKAKFFWYLAPNESSTGAPVELGMALCHQWHGARTQILISGPRFAASIYTAMAGFRDVSDQAVFEQIVWMAKRGTTRRSEVRP